MQKGSINVQTGNIFPIIKKFLYSEHEIFLRELVSNAIDATTKLKKLVSLGKADVELGDLTIQVALDAKKKTLKITDRGIGMTEEEVQKYINEIAFSGAEDFVKKYAGKDDKEISGIIGHFGLGFYSSFMVSDKV
ncbi:MAG TPA: ATP-binding protein, partial [Bacteroidales bacterium]|nr:ATP-binding protein [Bacteroidales bacterium]